MTTAPNSATDRSTSGTTAHPDGTAETTAAPPLGPELRAVVAIVVSGALITVLDATVVSIALKSMAADFAAALPTIQWAITGYLLAMVAVIPLSGWAVDRFGGRRAWLVAVGAFVAGSALCAVAWSAPTLIGFRILQGVGGGLVAPVGMTMVAQAAGPQRMGRAMAMVGIPMMLGPVLGPVLGGTLVSALDWRWIFLINLPIGVLTLAWSSRALPAYRPERPVRLDLLGLLLLSTAAATLVYGLSRAAAGASRAQVITPIVESPAFAADWSMSMSRPPVNGRDQRLCFAAFAMTEGGGVSGRHAPRSGRTGHRFVPNGMSKSLRTGLTFQRGRTRSVMDPVARGLERRRLGRSEPAPVRMYETALLRVRDRR